MRMAKSSQQRVIFYSSPLFNGPDVLFSASDKATLPAEIFSENSKLFAKISYLIIHRIISL